MRATIALVSTALTTLFYAANAMLLTIGQERQKHSGVISAFRHHFIKPGIIEAEYSHIYGETLAIRENADYSIEIPINPVMAELAVDQAGRFVKRSVEYLHEKGFWDETTK
jgi:uncharacterized protein (UPF0332 family)